MKKLLLLIVFFCLSSVGFSQWSTDPSINNLVTSTSGDQSNVAICPDGAGGIIMAWVDVNSSKIYAQKINAFGQEMWTHNGVLVGGSLGNQTSPCICSDAAGGAIIGWRDDRIGAFSIYAQRVRTDGVLMWDAGGKKVTTNVVTQLGRLKCIGAEAGYAIFAWNKQFGSPTGLGLYTQKVDANGDILWNINSVKLARFAVDAFDLCRDGAKGVYFTYSMPDTSSDGFGLDIYGSHVSAMGDTLWGIHHIICHDTLQQLRPSMCEDQDYGFIVVWPDSRRDLYADVYAARIDSQGVNQWTANGTPICVTDNNHNRPYCVSDNHGGAHVVWLDDRIQPVAGVGVYGQNVNHNGQIQWGASGKRIAYRVDNLNTADLRTNVNISSVDALGGMIACWIGYSDDALTHYGLLAQRLDYYGNTLWDPNGVFVSTSSLIKAPMMIFDGGSSGCNIAWADGRNFGSNGYDIYAQHVKSNASLGNRPLSNNTNSSKTTTVKQNYPNPFNPVTNISFDISQSGFVSLKIYDMTGREVAILANGVYNPGQYSVIWDASNFATGAYFYKFITNEKTEIKTMMLIK